MDQEALRAVAEGAVLTAMLPGAYMCELKSVRQMMLDDDFRQLYGHILLYELMPRLQAEEKEKHEMAVTLSQKLSMSKEATVTGLAGAAEQLRMLVLPVLSAKTPCMALGTAMFMMLFASAHDDLNESEEAREIFYGLSADMTPDMLVYAVFGDREYWRWDIPGNDEVRTMLEDKILDLQLLGVRGAIQKTLKEREVN